MDDADGAVDDSAVAETEPTALPGCIPFPVEETASPRPEFGSSVEAPQVRDLLLRRVEEQAEMLWAVFADALTATTASGRPDHRTRLLAARTLLAELYSPRQASPRNRPRVKDELAELRRRRGKQRASSG